MEYPRLDPLPSNVSISYARETPAPPGWRAYYASPRGSDPEIHSYPIILWVAVQYGAASDAEVAADAILDSLLNESAEQRRRLPTPGSEDDDGTAPAIIDAVVYALDAVERAAHQAHDGVQRATDNLAQELRPFVLARTGAIIDAKEIPMELLCLLGPDDDHKRYLHQFVRALRPDLLDGGEDAPPTN